MLSKTDAALAYESFVNAGIDEETSRFYQKKKNPVIFSGRNYKLELLSKLGDADIQASSADFNRSCNLPSLEEIVSALHFLM